MDSTKWPAPEAFTRVFCHRVRRVWSIPPSRICERAGVDLRAFVAWEAGPIGRSQAHIQPAGFGYMVYAALRQMVAEQAILTLHTLEDVEPYAQARVDYDALVRSIVGTARRHPRDPRLPPPPRPATPSALGWMP